MRLERSIFKSRPKGTYRLENKADAATIYLYDEIGIFGVMPGQFAKDMDAITAKTINLRINSPGGSVMDGTAIYNSVKNKDAHVVAHIDGLAASIASLVVMGADEIVMQQNAFLMIHEPWSIVVGGAEDLRKEADVIDKVASQIVGTFQDRTKNSEEQILDWMGAETWFTADEALEAGFVDRIIPNNGKEAKDKASPQLFDLSVFANTPESLQSDPEPPTERDLERVLRDAGCSRSEAKSILAEGIKARQRDAESAPEPEAIEPDKPRDAAPVDPVKALLAEVDTYLTTTRTEHMGADTS